MLAMACGGGPGSGTPEDSASGAVAEHVLEFEQETQNLRFRATNLSPTADPRLEICPELAGELRYGNVPFRLPGESATSNEHAFHFAAAYGFGAVPDVVMDFDQDGVLGCDEKVPLVPHPQEPGQAFRSLKLSRTDGDSSRRYRLTLPTALVEPSTDLYKLDLVDVPVARWPIDGRETLWILYDGNHDGVFDGRFGDGLLADLTGERQISTDPYDGNFFSLHLPLTLPWGSFKVEDLDPTGGSLTLLRLPDAVAEDLRPFEIGDTSRAYACPDTVSSPQGDTVSSPLESPQGDTAGDSISLGGATGKHQILYFWLSHCGSCRIEMGELIPVVDWIGSERVSAVGISLDEDADDFHAFVDDLRPGWPQCFLGAVLWDNPLARSFGVKAPSQFVLLDPEGKLLARGSGIARLHEQLAAIFPDLPLAPSE